MESDPYNQDISNLGWLRKRQIEIKYTKRGNYTSNHRKCNGPINSPKVQMYSQVSNSEPFNSYRLTLQPHTTDALLQQQL